MVKQASRYKIQRLKKDGVNATDFQQNIKLYLATQQCGGGLKEGKVSAGLFGLHSNVLKGC
jgi:hypothetical protein